MTSFMSDFNRLPEWAQFYRGRRVFVTGHTGFKGSWLSEWLLQLGAEVSGYSLEPDTEPALFRQLALGERMDHRIGDVRDPTGLRKALESFRPEVIFHLAAQPIVMRSYADPVVTFDTNVMGTVRLLDLLREWTEPCAGVFITSDKCYENLESESRSFREEDPMGGADPYSSSKGCAELAIHSFRKSYFSGTEATSVRIGSARAGNVVGGGDWAANRIVPDCIRSLMADRTIRVRNPNAIRPWQHVLEPLCGYLMFAHRIFPGNGDASAGRFEGCEDAAEHGASTGDGALRPATAVVGASGREGEGHGEPGANPRFAPRSRQSAANVMADVLSCFNFGPLEDSCRSVEEVVNGILAEWPGNWEDASDPAAPHEAKYLSLNSERAARHLGWTPVWDFETTIGRTVEWYRYACSKRHGEIQEFTCMQICKYMEDQLLTKREKGV